MEEGSGAGLGERLVWVMRDQHRLLVLDNCEHLRAACGDLAAGVLGSCPGVVVLATSRESLGLPGEVTWRVPSLTFPWPDALPTLGEMERFEAVPLFLARARAARAGALSLAEIAERLTGRFELLGRLGAGPARHQTLRASVQWSHQQLSQAERAVFRRRLILRARPGLCWAGGTRSQPRYGRRSVARSRPVTAGCH